MSGAPARHGVDRRSAGVSTAIFLPSAQRSFKFQILGEKSRASFVSDYGNGTVVVVAFDNVLSTFSALTDVTVKM